MASGYSNGGLGGFSDKGFSGMRGGPGMSSTPTNQHGDPAMAYGVQVDLGNGRVGFANPMTGEVVIAGESFGLPAGSVVSVNPSDPTAATASVATPSGSMVMGLDQAIGMFGGGQQDFGAALGTNAAAPDLGVFGGDPAAGSGYERGLAGPAIGQFGGPGYDFGTFGPGDVAIAMDQAGLDPGFNGIEGTLTKGEIAAGFGLGRLGGPSADESASAEEGADLASGWGGAGSAFDGANASMSASDFSNAVLDGIMAGGMGFGDIIGGGREMGIGSGFANLGSLGTNAFDGATPSGPAFGGFGDVAENEAGREGGFARGLDQASSNERSLGEISADQAARAGTIADIMSGSISSSPSSSENAFDAATPSGPSFGGFGDTAENEGFGGQVAGSFGADGISDGPGLAGSFGGGDVGVDIASGGFDSGRTGDFAQPGLGQSFGNGDAVAAAVGSENSIGPSFGGAEHGAAAASAISGSDIEGGAAGGLDGGTGMGGITGGSDITGGFGGGGFAGLGDGSGREAGIGGFGEAGTGSGFAGMSSGNAFDGGQSNNEADSSMGSSSEVASGGSSRGGRGGGSFGGDDGDMSGGWGGGGWGGESDGISGGFDRGGRGGEHGGLDGGGFGGGVGWG